MQVKSSEFDVKSFVTIYCELSQSETNKMEESEMNTSLPSSTTIQCLAENKDDTQGYDSGYSLHNQRKHSCMYQTELLENRGKDDEKVTDGTWSPLQKQTAPLPSD